MNARDAQERDVLATGRLLVIGGIAIAVGAAATAWSALIERPIPPQLTRVAPPSQRAHAIEDALYDTAHAAPIQPQRARSQLAAWSWADRGLLRVNLPITAAMDRWLARQAQPGRQVTQ